MAGENIRTLRDIPFDPKAYKDYLNSTDSNARQAARYIQQLVRSGQLDAQFRTTTKFDEAQARGEAERAGAITQAQRLEAPDLPAGSPFGPVVEEQAAVARERIAVEREKSLSQKRAANERARRRGDDLPYPDVAPAETVAQEGTGPRAPVVVPQQSAAMAARAGAHTAPASVWANVINVFKADPMAWDP